jgi:hypothetical protein
MVRTQSTANVLAILALAALLSLLPGQTALAQIQSIGPATTVYQIVGRDIDSRSLAEDFIYVQHLAGGLVSTIADWRFSADAVSLGGSRSAARRAAAESPTDWVLEQPLPGLVPISRGSFSWLSGSATTHVSAAGTNDLLKTLSVRPPTGSALAANRLNW